MQVFNENIDKIIPYARNPRKNEHAVDKLAALIKEFGFKVPVILDADNVIVCGHTRVEAAKKLGMTEIPCTRADDLTPAQIKAFRIADNKISEYADWDTDFLAVELEELQDAGFNLELTAFNEDEISGVLDAVNVDIDNEELDDTPEPPEEPKTERGRIYKLGNHLLMCGDSTSEEDVKRLMGSEKADMVFTDPPYGVDYDGGSKKWDKLKDDHIGTNIYSKVIPIIALFCDGPCYTWYAGTKPIDLYNAVDAVGDIHSLIIWVKNNSTFNMNIHYKQRHEPCLYWKPKGATLKWGGINTEDTVWEIDREPANEFHPTQKPIDLAIRAIKNHKVDLILDLFGGSGSTLIACEQTGRRCRMIELDEKYCDVIVKRYCNLKGIDADKVFETGVAE